MPIRIPPTWNYVIYYSVLNLRNLVYVIKPVFMRFRDSESLYVTKGDQKNGRKHSNMSTEHMFKCFTNTLLIIMERGILEMKNKRIDYIDVAKLIGIFLIYLGHCGESAGLAYGFVFKFHVPLFFFLSGCTAVYNNRSFINNLIDKTVKLLVPFWVFCITSIILKGIMENSYENLKTYLLLVVKGAIRNTFFPAALWFLTGLFVVEIVFSIIKLISKNPLFLLIISSVLHYAQILFITPKFGYPSAIYNIDSAMRYLVFFVIGYISFNKINKVLNAYGLVKIAVVFSMIMATIYTALLYFKIDLLSGMWTINFVLQKSSSVIQPLICIWCTLGIAYFFRENDYFKRLGKITLYFCGGEYIIKILTEYFLAIFGITINLPNPLSAFIITIVHLYLNYRLVFPILNYMVCFLQKLIVEKLRSVPVART